MKISKTPDGRQIIGIIDDEKALHFQWVYGFLVLGGRQDLPRLIEREKVGRVIIVSELLPESRTAIREIAIQSRIKLSEWQPEEHEVFPPES
jgi:FlaA1/EpsC-like NDP-sugar epimerase